MALMPARRSQLHLLNTYIGFNIFSITAQNLNISVVYFVGIHPNVCELVYICVYS